MIELPARRSDGEPSPTRAGRALLVEGYVPARGHDRIGVAARLRRLGRISTALLAGEGHWQIGRIAPDEAELRQPHRAGLKHHLEAFIRDHAPAGLLVLSGALTVRHGQPALVTAATWETYPDDATLPFAWLGAALEQRVARRLIVFDLLSIDARADAAREVLAMVTGGASESVIAVRVQPLDRLGDDPTTGLDALADGLAGEALDSTTGTITMHSMGRYLAARLPDAAVHQTPARDTLLCPSPFSRVSWRSFPVSTAALRTPAGALPPSATDQSDDLAGTVLPGRFRILREHARGGFGVVYEALQIAVGRHVAVKLLRSETRPDSEDGKQFLREIRSIGQLDHPNVVRIYQADVSADGRLFFVMELVRGPDLGTYLSRAGGRLSPHRAVEITVQLLRGLSAAHDIDILHCDIKPENVLLANADSDAQLRVVLVDFGLSRLHAPDRDVEALGGTPAYMAPEQIQDGRVDVRSDIFSAALILYQMLTGWQRRSWRELVPPLDAPDDEPDAPAGAQHTPLDDRLRAVLSRALALDPGARYPSAAAMADALEGKPSADDAAAARAPFRYLAPFTEVDEQRFFGRDQAIADLTERVIFGRGVVYTAPSGTGKTSLLRAGLVTRLRLLGMHPVYLSCRHDVCGSLREALWPGAPDLPTAIERWSTGRDGRLVIVLDQLERLFATPGGDEDLRQLTTALLGARDTGDTLCTVLSIREDFLARLLDTLHATDGNRLPVIRLGPLSRRSAEEALLAPLTAHHLAMEPSLIELMLDDLARAAADLAPRMGWRLTAGEQVVYPPHLQLGASVLCESLPPDRATLTVADYRRLGGLGAILAEHLEQVLDTELDSADARTARILFLELVTSLQTRRTRSDEELLRAAGPGHDGARVRALLERLRDRGLIVPVRLDGAEAGWEIVHDSLVPRILAWAERRDMARQQAKELLRYHTRRSSSGAPSLLTRAELREILAHRDVIAEVDRESSASASDQQRISAAALVSSSRRTLRRRAGAVAALLAMALAIIGGLGHRWWQERTQRIREREREQQLRDLNIGAFQLVLAPFDWDADAQRAVPVDARDLPDLSWTLHEPDPDDATGPGLPVPAARHRRAGPRLPAADGLAAVETVEARGGPAFLRIEGRGRDGRDCPPSWLALRWLPGYAERDAEQPTTIRVHVPTCAATYAGTIEIPGGPFVHAGPGVPPSSFADYVQPEETIDLPTFHIDRTEVTNAAYAVYAGMSAWTGHRMPAYPPVGLSNGADGPRHPVAFVDWHEARAYCGFLGKHLQTSLQWEKAARGGLFLDAAGQVSNDQPRRNLPWGSDVLVGPANLQGDGDPFAGAAPVGSFAAGASPYGVVDLSGNVQEWTRTTPSGLPPGSRTRIVRGGGFALEAAYEAHTIAYENMRDERVVTFDVGVRCVVEAAR